MAISAAERDLFRFLNAFVEPAVRAGLAGPCLIPFGLVVLETTGRHTGAVHRTPLLASLVDDAIIVGTIRRNSHWVRNARANPSVAAWVNGRRREGTAAVLLPGEPAPLPAAASQLVRALAGHLLARYTTLGWSFAIIFPRDTAGPSTASGARDSAH